MSESHVRMSYEDYAKNAAPILTALRSVTKAIDDSGLDIQLTELVKLRASQINGCAFCLQYHHGAARKAGVAQQKLDLLAAWRDAGIFTPREMAALGWTEALTRLGPEGGPEADYQTLRKHFSESETMYLTVAIGLINQWNRIAIGLRFAPLMP